MPTFFSANSETSFVPVYKFPDGVSLFENEDEKVKILPIILPNYFTGK